MTPLMPPSSTSLAVFQDQQQETSGKPTGLAKLVQKTIGKEVPFNKNDKDQVTPLSAPAGKEALKNCGPLIALLTPIRTNSIVKKIHELVDKDKMITDLICAIEEDNYKAPVFSHPDVDYYALDAVCQNKLTIAQFVTLMYLKAGICGSVKAEDVRVVPLFEGEDNHISQEAWNLIKETLAIPANIGLGSGSPYMEDAALNRWFEIMRIQPKSEQRFSIIPDSRDKDAAHRFSTNIAAGLPVNKSDVSGTSIADAVNNDAGFNVFCGLARQNNKLVRMIPSFSMMQAFLITQFGENAVTLKPVFNIPSLKRIAKSLANNERELSVPFPGISLPKTADGCSAPTIDFIFHDFYHTVIASAILPNHRKAFLELAAFVHTLQLPDAYKKIVKNMYAALVDLEMNGYLKNIRNRPQFHENDDGARARFWDQFNTISVKATIIQSVKDLITTKGEITEEEFQDLQKNPLQEDLLQSEISQKMGLYIAAHQDEWKTRYGITLASLDDFCNYYKELLRNIGPEVADKVYNTAIPVLMKKAIDAAKNLFLERSQ